MRYARLKFGILIVAIVLGLWSLYPTFQFYFVLPGQERALNARLSEATTRNDSLRVQTEIAKFQKYKTSVHKRSIHLGLDLVGGMHLALEVDKAELTAEQARDAGDRALEVIRNRIDQFGVFEPIIQKVGQDRILIQLPGVDRERAKSLIGQTAQLTFHLVAEERVAYDAMKVIDEKLSVEAGDSSAGATAVDSSRTDTATSDTWTRQFSREAGSLTSYVQTVGGDFAVEEADYPEFAGLLERSRPYWPKDYQFLMGPLENYQGRTIRRLYLLKSEPELRGSAIKDARPAPYQGSDPSLSNTWIVSLKLERKDAAVFAQVTGRNIGRRLAIVLDNVVKSAPVIQTRIPDGNAMITTNEVNPDEARDLSIVLRSGALPAPVSIVEERSVGPSLGNDSIRRGILAG
ncbi:MAG: hypothetical protein ABIL25_04995, partial [candidate division WOR-3 bacterium]